MRWSPGLQFSTPMCYHINYAFAIQLSSLKSLQRTLLFTQLTHILQTSMGLMYCVYWGWFFVSWFYLTCGGISNLPNLIIIFTVPQWISVSIFDCPCERRKLLSFAKRVCPLLDRWFPLFTDSCITIWAFYLVAKLFIEHLNTMTWQRLRFNRDDKVFARSEQCFQLFQH